MRNLENNAVLPPTAIGAIIIYGPSGCGKTRHASRLAKAYGKTRIIDDWVPGGQLDNETLALTACPHETAVPYLEAARFAGIRLPRAAARSIADATALVRA